MRARSTALVLFVACGLVVVGAGAFAESSPDHAVTPGATDPSITQQNVATTICRSGFASSVRDVSTATKHQVYASYHISRSQQRRYVIDHLVPLEIGGSNAVANLWPEPKDEAKEKDKLENALHGDVCRGDLTLADAQRLATGPVRAGLAAAHAARGAARRSADASTQLAEQQREQQIAAYVAARNQAELEAFLRALAAASTPSSTPSSVPSGGSGTPSGGGSGQVVHPGAFCAPAGARGVTSAGTPMVCGPASDGRNRWHSA
ncbi:MAG TPA: hypothetical protein VFC99_10575 [Acidimicrobiia bacterium]|nr:hypothetical protein [Acidimicrobiia bacterium]